MKKVLIVDDEKDLLEIIEFYLDEEGFRNFATLFFAGNGKEALALVREAEEPYDIIVSDINMPIMNGIEFIQTIQSEGCKTPIVILSGHSDPDTLEQVNGLKIEKFISKPFEAEEFAQFLKDVLD